MKDFPDFMKSELNVEIFNGIEHVLKPGDEVMVPKGTPHYGRVKAGTRTIHCFGGKRINN